MIDLLKYRIVRPAATLPLLGLLLFGPATAAAQNTGQNCVDQGFKPGTAGFYNCLQSAGESDSGLPQPSGDSDSDSGSQTDPDNAVTDFTGSTMDGATAPDPDLLKQLNGGSAAGR
jgi:hypothetical protein